MPSAAAAAEKPLELGTDGDSSPTLESSLMHIREIRPSIVVLENVVNLQALGVVREQFFIDSQVFGVCTSRQRMYVVAVETNKNALQRCMTAS